MTRRSTAWACVWLAAVWGVATAHGQAPHAPAPSEQHDHGAAAPDEPRTPIPPVTDADRAAAFPDVGVYPKHDGGVHTFVLLDRLEWQSASAGGVGLWDATGWVGGDLSRIWFRTEGEGEDGDLGDAEAHVLYGRAIARWWDVVVGLRQGVRPGPARTWAAFGVQGLAPYWFEVEATGYVGEGGRTVVRLEAEYDLLLTNRLIVQPRAELNLHGKRDVARGIGAGLTASEVGLRLRYELRRELAPYVGVTWNGVHGETADAVTAAGDARSSVRLVAGVRLWY